MFKTSDGLIHDRDWYLNVYLYSDHWKQLRGRKLAINPNCEVCRTHQNIRVHHVRYKQIYDVLLSDLLTMCEPCHKAEHKSINERNKRSKELVEFYKQRKIERRKNRVRDKRINRKRSQTVFSRNDIMTRLFFHNGKRVYKPGMQFTIYNMHTGEMIGKMNKFDAIKKYSANPEDWFAVHEKNGHKTVSLFFDIVPGFDCMKYYKIGRAFLDKKAPFETDYAI